MQRNLTLGLLFFIVFLPPVAWSHTTGGGFRDWHEPDLTCHTQGCLALQELTLFEPPVPPFSGCDEVNWRQHPGLFPVQSQPSCYRQTFSPNLLSHLSPEYRDLATETRNIGIMSVGIMLIIFALPESVSKWDRSQMKPDMLADNWAQNNRDGPVWDKDEWEINYIGHPYFGAVYYVVARNEGLSPLESFGYSFLMSTFLWEMGIEALAEIPSKQDLFITPVIGSVIGEAFYIWEQRILANQGELWGSYAAGNAALILLNPAGVLSRRINQRLDNPRWIQEARSYWVTQATATSLSGQQQQLNDPGWIGLEMVLRF